MIYHKEITCPDIFLNILDLTFLHLSARAYAQGTPMVGKIDDSLFIIWEFLLLPSQAQK